MRYVCFMLLYGTTTSPFVRRVRIVALSLGEPIEFINTAHPEAQAALRVQTPIGKVPVAVLQGRTVFDSRVIFDQLLVLHGGRAADALHRLPDRVREHNLCNAVDAALEAVISLFYLRRDGVRIDGTPFAERQTARAHTILTWLERELGGNGGFGTGLDLPSLSLGCALDWMEFRQTFPIATYRGLQPLRDALSTHPHWHATRPMVS